MPRDTVGRTLGVAALLCIVCSVLVSGAAVMLRPAQQINKDRAVQENILAVAGLIEGEISPQQIEQIFKDRVERKLVALDEGTYVDSQSADVDPLQYDQRKAARDPQLSVPIPEGRLPGIRAREKYAWVYLVKTEDGAVDEVILPIYGKGLWSTLYGFLALDADRRTIRGITFYEHAETPGLGGEVDNPAWKAQWRGKQAYNDDWDVQIDVLKGAGHTLGISEVDGLSGATITANGVEGFVRYWLSEDGFGKYIQNLPELETLRKGPPPVGPESESETPLVTQRAN